jgi:hypothetical protein
VIPLFVVAFVACVAMVLLVVLQGRHQSQLNALLAAVAAERYAERRERWDLNTRITAPEVVRAAPPAPPADAPPEEILKALQVLKPQVTPASDDEFDESWRVGTGPEA